MPTHIIYIGDPLCSWCYGFGPEMAGFLKAIPEPKLDIVMAGMNAYGTQTMTTEFKSSLFAQWIKVKETTGLPFNTGGLDHPGWVYDTEPICRAFVSAHMLYPTLPSMSNLALFGALQQGFYSHGLDITNGAVLAHIVCTSLNQHKHTCTEQQVLSTWQSEQAKVNTKAHFTQAEKWGITGFPSLLVVKGESLFLLSSGYTKTATLVEHFHKIQGQA
jgi:putative protein-disulfide isomerase